MANGARSCRPSGVSLAIILIFMQLGFLGAVAGTAVQIYDQLQFDVLLRSPDYFHFCDAREISRSYLYRVASMPEVASVKPLHVTLATWRVPENTADDRASARSGNCAGLWRWGWSHPPTCSIWMKSSSKCGSCGAPRICSSIARPREMTTEPQMAWPSAIRISDHEVEVWDKRFRIVGHFELGAGLAANGSVLMSSSGYARFFPGDVENNVNFGLVQLKEGIRPEEFCQHLKKQLFDPAATEVDATSSPAAWPC